MDIEKEKYTSQINVVTNKKINALQPKTSAEALREEPGISIQKTNHGGGSANIRGLSSNQILLMVDGVRLNNSTYRRGNHQYLTTVDYQMTAQMEIIKGPSSVGERLILLLKNPGYPVLDLNGN
jgi:outer membrane cobalamin receptor